LTCSVLSHSLHPQTAAAAASFVIICLYAV